MKYTYAVVEIKLDNPSKRKKNILAVHPILKITFPSESELQCKRLKKIKELSA